MKNIINRKELKSLIREIIKEAIGKEEGKPDEALYVEYVGQMKNETPFMLQGEKFEYVIGKYPDGKKDIAVYAFRGDLVYGYKAFRERYNIKT